MSKLKRAIVFTLVALCSVPFYGCKLKKEDKPVEGIAYTDYDLVKDGQSSYKILLRKDATETEQFASVELATFFEEATGVKLPIEIEGANPAQKDGYYLSVGNTNLFESSGETLNLSELTEDGFKLVTYGNSVLMNAIGESGKLYSVYDFLENQFNFEVYAEDEIYIDKTQNCKLIDFDTAERPDFEGRDIAEYTYKTQTIFATRKRLRGVTTPFKPHHGSGSVWSKTLWNHSTFLIMPKSDYLSEHPDWYSKDAKQLCFSKALEDSDSGRLFYQTFLENFKAYILRDPKAQYFMIGQEDVNVFCNCELCVANNALYGGEKRNPSGTLMVFANKVARDVKAWLKETAPERAEVVKVVIFAYQRTQPAPVTKDKQSDTYTCVDAVKAEDNVVVRFAPLAAVYSKNLMDEQYNAETREAILGWKATGAELSVWNYHIGFGAYEYPLYNFHTIQENYQIFKENGVVDIFDQGARDTKATPFCALRSYLHAELVWDVDLDMNVLINDFMNAYFKSAAPYMLEYFHLVNANYALMEKTQGYLGYAGPWESRDNALAEYYPKAYLNKCLEIFDRAYEAIEKIEDANERALVLKRVKTESLSPRYIMLDHYQGYYDVAQVRNMIIEFQKDTEKIGLSHYGEGLKMNEKIEGWLKVLN
jgi:hypothetical protein